MAKIQKGEGIRHTLPVSSPSLVTDVYGSVSLSFKSPEFGRLNFQPCPYPRPLAVVHASTRIGSKPSPRQSSLSKPRDENTMGVVPTGLSERGRRVNSPASSQLAANRLQHNPAED